MPSVGPRYPGTEANDTTIGTVSWSSLSNVEVDDTSYATASFSSTPSQQSYYLKATNFGFSLLPSQAIRGISVEIAGRISSPSGITDNSVKIVRDGTIGSENKVVGHTFVNYQDDVVTYGNSTDLWSTTWTPEQINSSTFGFVFSVFKSDNSANAFSLDYIRITLYYEDVLMGIDGIAVSDVIPNIGVVYYPNLPNKSDTVRVSENVTLQIFTQTFAEQNASITASHYKWLTASLKTAQQQNALRPYLKAYAYDDDVVFNSNVTDAAYIERARAVTAPDGSLLIVGKYTVNGDLGFWKIVDPGGSGIPAATFQTAPNVTIAATGTWLETAFIDIAVSEYVAGTYVIDVAYWYDSGSNYDILRKRSTNGGTSFSTLGSAISTGISNASLQNLSLAVAKPVRRISGLVDGATFYIRDIGTNQYAVYYDYYTGSAWVGKILWDPQTTDDWYIQSISVQRKGSSFFIYFSAYHTAFDTTSQNLGLWLVKLMYRGGSTLEDYWSPADEILVSPSAASQNENNFYGVSTTWDGEFLVMTFGATVVTAVKESEDVYSGDPRITTIDIVMMMVSSDMENFSYPYQFSDSTGNYFSATNYPSIFSKQGSYYYLSSNGYVWQFVKNDVVADLSSDVLKFTVSETAGSPSSLSLQLGNAENKWYGSSPTGVGYQAIARGKKILLYPGFYNSSGIPEVAPRNVYYIDAIKQMSASNKNQLLVEARDSRRNLKVLTTKYNYNFGGPNFVYDNFESDSLTNWSSRLGSWTILNNAFYPASSMGSSEFLALRSNLAIDTADTVCSVSVKITVPTAGGVVYFYPLYVDSDNWIRLEIQNTGASGKTAVVTRNTNGVQDSPVTLAGVIDLLSNKWYTLYVHRHGSYYFDFFVGPASTGGNQHFDYESAVLVNTTGSVYFEVAQYGNIGTAGVGCVNYIAYFSKFKNIELDHSLNSEDVIRKVGTKAKIWDYVMQKSIDDGLYNGLSNWTGNASLQNRIMTVPASGMEMCNTAVADGSIEFDAKMDVTTTATHGFDFMIRNQSLSNGLQTYYMRFEKRQDTSNYRNVAVTLYLNVDGETFMPSRLWSSAVYGGLNSVQNYSVGFDLSEWHRYKINFSNNKFSAFIDGVMVFGWIETNTSFAFNSGYFGFRPSSGGSLKVRSVSSPAFWQQFSTFSIPVGTDFDNAMRKSFSSLRSWTMTDLLGRFKILMTQPTDPVEYTYSTDKILTVKKNESSAEYSNQVTVYGDGVAAISSDVEAMSSDTVLRERVIVDYKIKTYADAKQRADLELVDSKKFNSQPDITLTINVGSELFDPIHVVNTGINTSGTDTDNRVYSQSLKIDDSTSAYHIDVGTGTI